MSLTAEKSKEIGLNLIVILTLILLEIVSNVYLIYIKNMKIVLY